MIATEQRLTYLLALSTTLRGVSVAMQWHEQEEKAIGQIIQSLHGLRAVGASLGQDTALAQLLHVYWKAGRNEEGHAALAQSMELIGRQGSDWWECEMLRLGGELELQRPIHDWGKAEAYFQRALEIARRQSAKGWELRVVMSLSRLWNQQGKRQEAQHWLSEIYGWFTEGFDTTDLKEAKALLGQHT